MKPSSILDRQVEATLAVWFGPTWSTFVQLSDLATPAYAQLVTDAGQRMRRALIAARKVREP
jgi:hypothetical protein